MSTDEKKIGTTFGGRWAAELEFFAARAAQGEVDDDELGGERVRHCGPGRRRVGDGGRRGRAGYQG